MIIAENILQMILNYSMCLKILHLGKACIQASTQMLKC